MPAFGPHRVRTWYHVLLPIVIWCGDIGTNEGGLEYHKYRAKMLLKYCYNRGVMSFWYGKLGVIYSKHFQAFSACPVRFLLWRSGDFYSSLAYRTPSRYISEPRIQTCFLRSQGRQYTYKRNDERKRHTWNTWLQGRSLRGWASSPASTNLSFSWSFSPLEILLLTMSSIVLLVCSILLGLELPSPVTSFLLGSSKSIKQIAQAARLPSSVTNGYSPSSQFASHNIDPSVSVVLSSFPSGVSWGVFFFRKRLKSLKRGWGLFVGLGG